MSPTPGATPPARPVLNCHPIIIPGHKICNPSAPHVPPSLQFNFSTFFFSPGFANNLLLVFAVFCVVAPFLVFLHYPDFLGVTPFVGCPRPHHLTLILPFLTHASPLPLCRLPQQFNCRHHPSLPHSMLLTSPHKNKSELLCRPCFFSLFL